MNIGILVLLILSILIIFYFVVRLILNYKKGGFLYKSALKTIKSFSFSMVLLLLFYGFTFGYSFGSITANETYKQELLAQNLENNAHSMLVKGGQLNKGTYGYDEDEGEADNLYLTEDYWNLIFGTSDSPESGILDYYVEYDPSYSWDDFNHLLLPDGYLASWMLGDEDIILEDPTYTTIYEPIYGEDYGITPFSYYGYSSRNYLQHAVWDKFYDDFHDEYEIYYRSVTTSSFVGRTIKQTELMDYRSYDIVSLNDYNPITNTYYSSFDDMYNENTFNDKVEVSERVKKDTKYDDDTYVVGKYKFSNLVEGYSYDDLLSVNNHYYDSEGNLTSDSIGELESFNSLNIEIAISEQFYEANPNIVLGNSYEFALNDGNKLVKLTPIATFSDAYSLSNDKYFGSFLINYLDFNILKYNFRSTGSQMDSDLLLIVQTEDFMDNNSIRMHTSESYLESFRSKSILQKYINDWNEILSYALFDSEISELSEDELDAFGSFTAGFTFSSTQDHATVDYYGNNLTGYSTFLIVNIFNMIILLMIFLVVIFIIYSVIGKKIKEQFKQFGILKSMGYKTDNISISFILFPILILFIANILALLLMTPFYFFQINNLQSRFFVVINNFAFPTLIAWLVIAIGILLFFSYLKIWRSLRKSELYLLSGSKRFSPGLLFRGASKISTKFKSFETSYAFKNIFKSIPKSSIVFTSVLFSLVIVGLALMISSFVKVNIDDNFSAVNFSDYYYDARTSAFGYGNSNGLYRSLKTDYRSYQEYNASNLDEAIDEAFILGDYVFANTALETYDASLSFEENFAATTGLILDYMFHNPVVERNELVEEETANNFDLFDYAYISTDSMKQYFELEALLFKDYKLANPLSSLKQFFELPFVYESAEYSYITFGNLNNYYINNATTLFKKFLSTSGIEYINQNYSNIDISDLNIDDFFVLLSDLNDDGIKLYDDFFPNIYFGRTLYDKDTTALFSYASSYAAKTEDTTNDDLLSVTSLIFEDLEQINTFFNFETKKGDTVTSLLKKEIPNKNKNYIPVVVDEGTSKMFDVKAGDYFYAHLDENSVFYELEGSEFVPLKVIGVYKKHDYGIITSQEFVTNRYGGVTRIYDALATFDSQVLSKTVSAGFTLGEYNHAIEEDENIYLIQDEEYTEDPTYVPGPTTTSFAHISEPKHYHYSIPLLHEVSSRVYKEITIAIMLSIIFILVIPLFIILISIKEVIDDNVVEVSMLKSLGYNTWQTSRLILSSSLVIVGFSFVVLLPLMFLFGFIFNIIFINLFALDLTFKLLWWNWLILLFMLILILGILYSVSYYFYYKLKSKDVILNISK